MSLNIRNFTDYDNEYLVKLWHNENPPNLSDPRFIGKKIIFNGNDEVVAIAAVKLIGETYMCLNNDSSRKNKVIALKEMISQLKDEMKKFRLNNAVSFTTIDESLMKHFGFQSIDYPTKVSLFL